MLKRVLREGLKCFNTRARARRARACSSATGTSTAFQHTCPREAGTARTAAAQKAARVSTHVPARGGHARLGCHGRGGGGFNTRARARRARCVGDHPCCTFDRFNTRARARRARPANRRNPVVMAVSTHVPARGGHVLPAPGTPVIRWFQHTCPREAGTCANVLQTMYKQFQHTCPREAGTCDLNMPGFDNSRFNTRARARRARMATLIRLAKTPFQHTCPREAGTNPHGINYDNWFVSTHVPARGGHLYAIYRVTGN